MRASARRAIGIGLAAGVALGMLAATASSGFAATASFKSGPIDYIRDAGAVQPGEGSRFAVCPSTSRLTGVGASYGGPKDQLRIGSMTPFDLFDPNLFPDDAALTEVYNDSGSSQPVRSFAICLRNGKGGAQLLYEENAGSTIAQGASVGSGATATCPGSRVLGGGIYIPGPATAAGEERLNSSHPRDSNGDLTFAEGWRGSYNVSNSSVERTPQARAACLPSGALRIRHRFTAEVAFPGITKLRRGCTQNPKNKKGWRVVGGGVQGFFERIVASMPFDSNDHGNAPDNGWRGVVQVNPGANPQALLVHVVCVKKL